MFGLWILVAKFFRQFGENVGFIFSHLKKICAYGEKKKDNANPAHDYWIVGKLILSKMTV